MLKLRITFSDPAELEEAIKNIEHSFLILNKSKIYKGRNGSIYANIYLDVENKK